MKKQLFLGLLLLTGVGLHGDSNDRFNVIYADGINIGLHGDSNDRFNVIYVDGTKVTIPKDDFLSNVRSSLGQSEVPGYRYNVFRKSYDDGVQWARKNRLSSPKLKKIKTIESIIANDGIPHFEKMNFSNEVMFINFLKGIIMGYNRVIEEERLEYCFKTFGYPNQWGIPVRKVKPGQFMFDQ